VIPARWGSTRLPGKVLADVCGRSLLARVHDLAVASGAERVLVAVDDDRVEGHARAQGFEVVRTGAHASGTDRVAAVAAGWATDLRIVNLQGDAPLIDPTAVRAVAEGLRDPAVDVATASTPLDPVLQDDPHVVKVAGTTFSRAPLPGARRHLGVYGYRNAALQRWAAAPPTVDERRHRLEQLRPLAMGLRFVVVPVGDTSGPDVDTPADLVAVRRLFATRAALDDPTAWSVGTLPSVLDPGAPA